MTWTIKFHDDFEKDSAELGQEVQDELLAMAKLLRDYGPNLRRPHADTLKGSRFHNLKELRFAAADGAWRAAFAFDPNREAILLAAGDKSGGSEAAFYRRLVAKAEDRYQSHLDLLKIAEKKAIKSPKEGR